MNNAGGKTMDNAGEKTMDNNKKNIFENFIKDDFAMSYFSSIDSNLRTHMSTINSSCEELLKASDDKCSADFRAEIVNKIMKACCSILRPADVMSKIVEANKGYAVNKNIVELSGFFTKFCNNCNERIGKECKVQMKKTGGMCCIEVSEKFLLAVLLMCVRNALFNQAKKIDISYAEKLGDVIINMKIKKSKTENDMFSDTDYDGLYKYTPEIISSFVEKINGKIEIGEDEITIMLSSSNGDALHEKKLSDADNKIRNQYNLQLAEFNDSDYY